MTGFRITAIPTFQIAINNSHPQSAKRTAARRCTFSSKFQLTAFRTSRSWCALEFGFKFCYTLLKRIDALWRFINTTPTVPTFQKFYNVADDYHGCFLPRGKGNDPFPA